jgi:hypothetical protein
LILSLQAVVSIVLVWEGTLTKLFTPFRNPFYSISAKPPLRNANTC